MHTKQVYFLNKQKEKLAGILHLPHNKTSKAVIVCHGFGSNKDELWIPTLCTTLSYEGFAALRFDFSGNGTSEGNFSASDCEKEQEDLASAIKFLQQQEYKTFAIIGHSMGGTVVLMHAAKESSVKAVIAIAAAIHTKKVENRLLTDKQKKDLHTNGSVIITLKGKHYTLKKHFFDAFEKQNVLKEVNQIKAPLLLIHGSDDHTIPVEESKSLAEHCSAERRKGAAQKAAPQLKLTVIEGGSHTLMRGKSAETLIETITQWLEQNF